MQQLEGRNTYTPTDIPHVSGNCGLVLNREETLSVSGIKTLSNNSDAVLTATGHAGQDTSVPAVYVLNMRGYPLMPTTPRKARILLQEGKAKELTLLQSASTLLIDILGRGTLLPVLKYGISVTPAPQGKL